MADQTSDPRFESLLRQVLASEAARLPLAVRPRMILERAASGQGTRRFGLGIGTWRRPSAVLQLSVALATVAILAVTAAIGLSYLANRQGVVGPPPVTPSPTPQQPVDLGIFGPMAGRIVYGNGNAIRAVDPSAPPDSASVIELTGAIGSPLGWSGDGTRLLILRENQLFILHADGSETQVTEQPVTGTIDGAAISPDGSRVLYVRGNWLFVVDAEGGPSEMLFDPVDSLLEGATFSADGTQIAYVYGSGDNGHRVWVMDADGTDAHQILANDTTLAAGHVRGLAWSPAGDRIALALFGFIYTFGSDGSDFKQVAGAETTCSPAESCAEKLPNTATAPYWSPDGLQIAYTRGCADGSGLGCGLGVANRDGSNVREFGYALSGPWHPALRRLPSTAPTPASPPTDAPPSATPEVSALLNSFMQARIAGAGADQYLTAPDDLILGGIEDIPDLYATSSGARYERAEFEQVLDVGWPYGWTAFKVRLFAGSTVVEQLFFISEDNGAPALHWVPDGFGTDIAPATENGQPIARPYIAFDGEVILTVAHPWGFQYDGGPIRLIPEGALPSTDGGERGWWNVLILMKDPVQGGFGCPHDPGPADAEALAESIASDPRFETTAPVRTTFGATVGFLIDVAIANGASGTSGSCGPLSSLAMGTRDRMRLYLFDASDASSFRVLAIAIVIPESRFQRAVAGPVIDSVEFRAP
ncbi:MAG: hypothetical protein QOJ81_2148 [Chloroflexota bacterium]|nr:hypothetical protein [Chloroflexota bacterium]